MTSDADRRLPPSLPDDPRPAEAQRGPRAIGPRRLFLQQFRQNFHTTGAVLPSSRFLARALTEPARAGEGHGPRSILEIGPGTGAVTQQLTACLGPGDHLLLAEINEAFVACLRRRLAEEPSWSRIAHQVAIHHGPAQAIDGAGRFDLIVSGLPLNNFSVELVEELLAAMLRLLRPGGTLSFFEYIAIRRVKRLVSGSGERQRLQGIERAIDHLLAQGESRREAVWWNVPPAWVHHLRMTSSAGERLVTG